MNQTQSNPKKPRSGKNAFPPPLKVIKRSPQSTPSDQSPDAKAPQEKPPSKQQKNNNNPTRAKDKGEEDMDSNYGDASPVSPGGKPTSASKASSQYANNFSKTDARFSTAAQSNYGNFDPLDYATSEMPPLPSGEIAAAAAASSSSAAAAAAAAGEDGDVSEELRQRRREEKQRREEEWEEEQAQRKRERERLAQERRQKEIQEEEEKRRREWAEEEERRRRRNQEDGEDFDEEIPRRQSPPRQEQYQRRPSGPDRRNSYARHSFHRQNDNRDYRRYNSSSNSGNEEENSRGDTRRERININMNDAWQSWTSMGGRDDRGGIGIGGTPGFGLFGGVGQRGFGPVGNLPINMPLNSMPGLGGFRMFGL